MKKSSRTALVLACALTATGVTACGGGAGVFSTLTDDSYSQSFYSAGAATNEKSDAFYPETTVAETAAAGEAWEMEMGTMSDLDSGLTSASALTSTNGEGAEAPSETRRKLIRNVNLEVETTEFDTLIDTITQYVNASGGYIEQSDMSGNSISNSRGRRYAYITARIPADQLDAFLTQMDEQSNVTYRSESVQDVTLQYTDIESRKKSLTVEQERLWELLEKADSLDSVIALEQRLSEIRYELERFESQLRTYDNQVDYSTVYINIDEVAVFTPTEPDSVITRIQKGFTRNLQNVGNGFINFFVWFVSSLPTLVVWAIFIAILVVILRAIVKRCRKTGRPVLPLISRKTSQAGPAPAQNPAVPVPTQPVTPAGSPAQPQAPAANIPAQTTPYAAPQTPQQPAAPASSPAQPQAPAANIPVPAQPAPPANLPPQSGSQTETDRPDLNK